MGHEEAAVRVIQVLTGRWFLSLVLAVSVAAGLWEIGARLWIYMKAGLAQVLLQRAWPER